MDGWDQVRWTEARQIAEQMRLEEEAWPEPGITPRAHYAALRAAEDRAVAIRFIGHALPRMEAVAWGCAVLDAEASEVTLPIRDRRALDASLRWLGDPTDNWRRAAYDAAEEAGEATAEKLLGLAVFFSGGSISQPDLPPVLPPPSTAGAMAAAAVTTAAYRAADPIAALDRALDLGDKLAVLGTVALQDQ